MLIIGREEWVTLTNLGIGPLKAKIDTGAKTSSIHAEIIRQDGRVLLFRVPGHNPVCEAMIVDRREVLAPNRGASLRYVITTSIAIGDHSWQIEVTLADRTGLSCPMILGREALRRPLLVDPNRECLLAGPL
ncbi:hypothetical protein SCG7086_BC_00110 [Chlamydiales bacterium SCGC AG-110-P3]|nr:hypothetical protein SCG7086_BC_00110 [Chlamydiales bacterium SCGC AG-110-P3]